MEDKDKKVVNGNMPLSEAEVKERASEVDRIIIDDDDKDDNRPKYNRYNTEGIHHTRRNFHDLEVEKAGVNLSWRSIFAGLLTFLALSILFSLISTSIGLGVTDLTATNPLEGVGTGLIIWTIISFIISLCAGGYVAGFTANRAGAMHGFLTWAIGLVAALYIATSALGSAFNTIGSLLGVAGNSITNVATTAGKVTADLSQEAFDTITSNLQLDTTDLDKEVQDALVASEIPELQPNFLQSQLDDTVTDIQDAAKAIVVDGKDAGIELEGVYAAIEERLTSIGEGLDEEKLSNAIAENTDLSEQEAAEAVENVKTSYAEAQENAKKLLNDAETQLNELVTKVEDTSEEVVETTNKVMNETSKYSIIAFISLAIAAALSTLAGKKGAEAGTHALDGATEVDEVTDYN